MDFLIPQLYWETHVPAQSYSTLLEWWSDIADGTGLFRNSHAYFQWKVFSFLLNVNTGVLVYGGNGLYRLDSGDLDWPAEEIGIQVDISRASSLRQQASMGNCQYSAKYIRDDVKGTCQIC